MRARKGGRGESKGGGRMVEGGVRRGTERRNGEGEQ